MKFTLDEGTGTYAIRSYAAGQVVINETILTRSFVVLPERLVSDWPPQSFDELRPEHFEAVVALKPEVVVLGCGDRLRFPSRHVIGPLTQRHIGLEVMDTGAACRTYNVLMSEGRLVAAALLIMNTARGHV